jgi:hypothetical protein
LVQHYWIAALIGAVASVLSVVVAKGLDMHKGTVAVPL